MDISEKTIGYIKARGHKITNVRTFIIKFLANSKSPLSVTDILADFAKVKMYPNKTTIYRELKFLTTQNIIQEIDFGENKKRYEFNFRRHHHHIICVKCKKIDDVTLSQDLTSQEMRISREKKFKIISHSLEFFGLCSKCYI